MSNNILNENEFIHDLVNKLTMSKGKISRIVKKSEKFSKEEIVEMAQKAEQELDAAFELIKARKSSMAD